MTDPSPDRSHIVTNYLDREGQHWYHAWCTCGIPITPSDVRAERDAAAEPHRQAHRLYLERPGAKA